jgi:two-component system sensor histidine kinase TctE
MTARCAANWQGGISAMQVRVKNGVISVAVAETIRKRDRAHYTILLSFLLLMGR